MSITNLSRGGDDFRAAAGLASWSPDTLDLAPETAPVPRGPGLFEVVQANGRRAVTNVRRLAGAERTPGTRLILAATVLLGLLAAGLFAVSLSAQYRYVLEVKHVTVPSAIEAVGLDAGMAVFSLLALGLAMAGQSARIERALIVVCAVASAGQNYAAADVTSPRSVAAYIVPPLFLAVVVDRVVAVVRRHVLGDAERSVWAGVGRGLTASAKGLGLVLLYLLRFVLAPPSTGAGLRRVVLIAAPLPAAEKSERHDDDEDQGGEETREPAELEGATKKARLTWWYERDASYGDRGAVAAAAARGSCSPGTKSPVRQTPRGVASGTSRSGSTCGLVFDPVPARIVQGSGGSVVSAVAAVEVADLTAVAGPGRLARIPRRSRRRSA